MTYLILGGFLVGCFLLALLFALLPDEKECWKITRPEGHINEGKEL